MDYRPMDFDGDVDIELDNGHPLATGSPSGTRTHARSQ
jgi:hypothetical protein